MNVIGKRTRQSERLEAIKLGKTWCKNAPYLAPIYGYSPKPKDGSNQHHGPCKALSRRLSLFSLTVWALKRQNAFAKDLERKSDGWKARRPYAFNNEKILQIYRQQTKLQILTKIVNEKSVLIIFMNKMEQRDPNDFANGGIERGSRRDPN